MKLCSLLLAVCFSFAAPTISWAKKVKFSVDMTGTVLNSGGVHITGDFQSEAGLGGDFASLTPMVQEGSSQIYSLTVDIPAFEKYEYKFVNGAFFYDAEFVPIESRVGYNSVDNRWIYIDSLNSDTLKMPAVLYAGNAPQGLKLFRPKVNMDIPAGVSPNGVHLAGNWQGWSATNNRMYSFGNLIYETIVYVNAGTVSYKFYNGNTTASLESVPPACATSGNRQLSINSDSVLSEVCFSSCTNCSPSSLHDALQPTQVTIAPNPATNLAIVRWHPSQGIQQVVLKDAVGKVVRTYATHGATSLIVEKQNLSEGLYFISLKNENTSNSAFKLLFY